MRAAKAQISLRVRAVWSRPSLSANRITGYYEMYELWAKAQSILCACTGWSETATFASKALFRLTPAIYPYRHSSIGWHPRVRPCTTIGILLVQRDSITRKTKKNKKNNNKKQKNNNLFSSWLKHRKHSFAVVILDAFLVFWQLFWHPLSIYLAYTYFHVKSDVTTLYQCKTD